MTLLQLYPAFKHMHIGLAVASVGLFALRGLGVLIGARWPMQPTARNASMVIDSLLLAAGGTLWWMLSLNPLHSHWLGVKLLLVVVYIVLGILALKRARSWPGKALAFVAALACVAAVALIARRHDAWAPIRFITGA